MTYASTITKIVPEYPYPEKVIVLPIENSRETSQKSPKLKKDGTPKRIKSNKKKGSRRFIRFRYLTLRRLSDILLKMKCGRITLYS